MSYVAELRGVGLPGFQECSVWGFNGGGCLNLKFYSTSVAVPEPNKKA